MSPWSLLRPWNLFARVWLLRHTLHFLGYKTKTFMVSPMKVWFLALALTLAPCLSPLARSQTVSQAQSDDSEDEDSANCKYADHASLFFHADKEGFAVSYFTACFEPGQENQTEHGIGSALYCPAGNLHLSTFQSDGLTGLEATCETRLLRRGLHFSGELDLSAIQSVLQGVGGRAIDVEVWQPTYGDARCNPDTSDHETVNDSLECRYSFEKGQEASGEIKISFGYTVAEAARTFGILGLLLLVPIVAVLWLRRRAMTAPEEERPTIWFAYFRFLRWTVLAGALIWWAAIDLLGADSLVTFLLPSWRCCDSVTSSTIPWIVLWLPAAIVYGACQILSVPIHELRGVKRTKSEAIRQAFWGVGRLFIPFVLLVAAVGEMFESPRTAVVLFAATFVAARLAGKKLLQAYGLEFQAVSSGELRDRAFALAERAKARLQQLYVLPTDHIRMANAFAHMGNNIFLTDYLLKNLSKHEVDAVIGHEVAHLQKKHIRMRLLVLFVCVGAMFGAGIWLGSRIPERFPSGPVFYACMLLTIFLVSRRNEFAADAGAAKLTGDPEAMITGLAKLSRLNTMPMQWGRIEEKTLTHPSMLKRITRLARSAGIAEERIPELLRQSATAPLDVYTIPATSLPQGKVFSTRFRTSLAFRLSWSLLVVGVITPTIVAWIAQRARLGDSQLWRAYGAGLIFTWIVSLVVSNFLPMLGLGKLERLVRSKFEKQGAPAEIPKGMFVSLAPDSEPRIYENNWAWDVGFLLLSPERLYYWGEEARFAIGRDDVIRIWAGPGPFSWIKTTAAYVSWTDRNGQTRTLNLRACSASSLSQMSRITRLLARDLENWRSGLPAASDATTRTVPTDAGFEAEFRSPGFGAVTSMAPKDLARGQFLVRDLFINTFLAVGIGVLFGLRFSLLDWLVSSPGAAAEHLAEGTGWYVLAAVWINRMFLLFPIWRNRHGKDKAIAAAAPMSSSVE
jgi:heat shock protein HtpX